MPIHLIWGDDTGSRNRSIEKLIEKIVDPVWRTLNITRHDGNDHSKIDEILEEVRTPPFGNGARVVLIQASPFCNGCSNEIAKKFEGIIDLIPQETHLILSNSLKPDGRLKTTKILQKLVKSNLVEERSFVLPAIWDLAGQKQLIQRTAKELGLLIDNDAILALVEAIGTDSARLQSELEKFSLLQQTKTGKKSSNQPISITIETVNELVEGITTNALQVGDSLLEGKLGEALLKIDALLDSGEPALRIVASITTQIRGWLWVSLLDPYNSKDVGFIAKTAGIANPKRIYVIRKQIKGKPSKLFLSLLNCLLEIEVSIKKGIKPSDAFKDGFLSQL